MNVFVTNGHDYSQYIERSGYGWARNDLDSDKTTRLKNGNMRRYKITTKRTLSYTLMTNSREILAQLDDDLSRTTFSATYYDLHGEQTRTFYCSSFAVTLSEVQDDTTDQWEGASFTIVEV